MPLQPTASLPSLLRCIIQCFSHNRLRSEGLSLPQPCGEQSANMEEALDPRLRLRAAAGFSPLGYICANYSARSAVDLTLRPQWTSGGTHLSLGGGGGGGGGYGSWRGSASTSARGCQSGPGGDRPPDGG